MLVLPVKGVIFDLDESLTQGFSGDDLGAALPGSLEVLGHLDLIKMFYNIGSNQSGSLYKAFEEDVFRVKPEWGHKKYPTTNEVIERVVKALESLQRPHITVLISTYDPYLVKLLSPTMEEEIADASSWEAEHQIVEDKDIEREIAEAAEEIAREITIGVRQKGFINVQASAAKKWRKPDIEMLEVAARIIEAHRNEGIARSQLVYMGDRHEGVTKAAVDQWAAKKIGMQFLPAENKRELLSLRKAE